MNSINVIIVAIALVALAQISTSYPLKMGQIGNVERAAAEHGPVYGYPPVTNHGSLNAESAVASPLVHVTTITIADITARIDSIETRETG